MAGIKDPLETAKLLIDKLFDNKPFYFVRFGDGDLLMMLMPQFDREKLHKYDCQLRRDLYHCFHVQDENFLIGCVDKKLINGGCKDLMAQYPEIKMKLRMRSSVMFDDMVYENAVPFHNLIYKNKKQLMFNFIKCFQNKKVLYIGGEKPLKHEITHKLFNISDSIIVPDRDAYQELKNNWDKYAEKAKNYDVVIPACGLGSRPLAYHLYIRNVETTFIDIGSVIDAMALIGTRTWINEYQGTIRDIIKYIKRKLK